MARQALLWKLSLPAVQLSKPQSEAYLLGTMHTASGDATQKVPQILGVVHKCSHFFGETNLDSPIFQEGFKSFETPGWPGLNRIISPGAYTKARRLIRLKCDLELDRIQSMPPMMLTALLSEHLLAGNSMSQPMDISLWTAAKNAGLTLGAIESAEEQERIYKKIPLRYQIKALKQMVCHISRSTARLHKLGEAYKKEDLDQIWNQTGSSLEGVRRILLYDRNKIMADRIGHILQTSGQRSFIAVGAAHLPGAKGILRYLDRMHVSLQSISLNC